MLDPPLNLQQKEVYDTLTTDVVNCGLFFLDAPYRNQ